MVMDARKKLLQFSSDEFSYTRLYKVDIMEKQIHRYAYVCTTDHIR